MVPGLEVFPRASSALILADGVGAISQFLGYLVDFRGLILRDRKTENGELCSLRGARRTPVPRPGRVWKVLAGLFGGEIKLKLAQVPRKGRTRHSPAPRRVASETSG